MVVHKPLADHADFVGEWAVRTRDEPGLMILCAELHFFVRPKARFRADDAGIGAEADQIDLVAKIPFAPTREAGSDGREVLGVINVARFYEGFQRQIVRLPAGFAGPLILVT